MCQKTDGELRKTWNIEVRNSLGERITRIDPPSAITAKIDEAISRGQLSGSVAGVGNIWKWRAIPEDTATIEITRDDIVIETMPPNSLARFRVVRQAAER